MGIVKSAKTALAVVFLSAVAGVTAGNVVLQTDRTLTPVEEQQPLKEKPASALIASFAAMLAAGGACFAYGRRSAKNDAPKPPQA